MPTLSVLERNKVPVLDDVSSVEQDATMKSQHASARLALARIRIAAVTVLLVSGLQPSLADDIRPVRILVGTSPGGPADLLARLFGEAVGTHLGAPFMVENKPGASGTIAARAASSAQPDGKTVLVAGIASMMAAPYVYPRLGYNPARDLVPIGILATSVLVLVASPALPVQNVQALIALARASRPLMLTYGSAGNGSVNHLCTELLSAAARVPFRQIPFAGDGPASNSLLAGDVQFMFMAPNLALSLAKAGRLNVLAVSGLERLGALPDVPTMAESGFAGFECRPWTMAFVPSATPRTTIDRLAQAWTAALQLSATRARIEAAGLEAPRAAGMAEAAAFLRAEQARLGPVMDRALLKNP